MDNLSKYKEKNFLPSFLGIVGCMLLFLLILLLAYLPYRPGPVDTAIEQERKTKLAELDAKAEKDLTTYRWINQQKGIVGIPIEQAMKLTVDELNAKQ